MKLRHTSSTFQDGSPLLRFFRRGGRGITSVMLLSGLTLWSVQVSGADTTWTAGSSVDFQWSNLNNWSLLAAPTAADNALFSTPFLNPGSQPDPNIIILGAGSVANGLGFDLVGAPLLQNFSLTGGDLTLTSGAIRTDLGMSVTIGSQLNGTGGLTITGGGAVRLTNNTNGYTGITSINNGSLTINNQLALGTDTSQIVVSGSATRGSGGGSLVLEGDYASGVNLSRGISLQGLGPISDRNAALVSVRNNTVSGAISIGTPLVNTRIISTGGLLTMSGGLNVPGAAGTNIVILGGVNQAGAGNYLLNSALTGSGTLEKSGSGTLWLTPSGSSGFSGVVRMSTSATGAQSSVRITTPNVLGTRTTTTTGAVLDLNGGILEVLMDTPSVLAGGANALLYGRAGSTIFADHSIGGTAINGTLTFGAFAFEENQTFTFNSRNGYNITVGATPVQGGNNNSTFTNNLGGGGTLTFNGAFWSNSDGTNRTMTVGGNGNTILTGNIVASGGSHSFVKAGTGTLTVNGTASTYRGNTTIAGTLSVGNLGAINKLSPTGSVLLNTGTLTYTGAAADTLAKPFSLIAATGNNAVLSNGSGVLTLTGNVGAGGVGAKTLFLGGTNTGNNTFSSLLIDNNVGGATTGPTSLTKIGTGTWVLTEPNPAAYGSATSVTISAPGTTATNIVTLSSGTTAGLLVGQVLAGTTAATPPQITGIIDSTRFTVGVNLTTTTSPAGTYTVDSIPTTSTATAGGTWSGALTIAGGTLKLAANNAASNIVQNTNPVVFNVDALNANQVAGGTLEFVGLSGFASTETLGALTPTIGAGNVVLTSGGGGSAANLVFSSLGAVGRGSGVNFVTTAGGGGTVTLGGVATSTATTLPGNGHFYINGSNFARSNAGVVVAPVYDTDAGFVNAAAGAATLTASNHNQVTGNITAQTAVAVTSLKIAGSQNITLTGNLTVNTGAVANDGGILQTGGAAASIGGAGQITTGGAGAIVIRVDGLSDVLTLNSQVASTTTGGLTKNGAGRLVIAGINAQTGTTTINEGTVQLSGTGRLSAANQGLDLRQGATLDLNGLSSGVAIGAFNGSGLVTNTNLAAATLVVGNATTGAGTFSGIIQDGAGVVNVTKTGTTGAPTWSGLNTYTGVTTIGGTTGLVSVPILANYGSASGIGRGIQTVVSDANNAASLVFTGTTSGINYTGSNSVSIDRLFTLNGSAAGSGGQIANASPTNAALILNKTNPISFGAGATVAQTLTLGGASTGDSQFNLQIVDNAALPTSLSKIGAGRWLLGSASNSFTGTTTIANGFLNAQDGTSLPSTSGLILGSTTTAGVLETSGDFIRNIVVSGSAGANTVSWNANLTTAGSGFAAVGGKVRVAFGGVGTETALTWGTGGFATSTTATAPLILNSAVALNEIEWRNPIDLNAAVRTIQVDDNTNTATDFATITGVLSGTGASGISKTQTGVLQLLGANTYTGNTAITAGTVVVTSLGNSASAGATSVGDSAAGNTSTGAITLGNGTTTGGILQYIGTGETSDRMIRLNTTTGTNQIHADGSGALILTNVLNDMTGGAKVLQLRGSNTASNMITSALLDNGGTLGVTVDGGATWVLAGANTYTGTTTVSAGALGLASNSLGDGTGNFDIGNGVIFAYGEDRAITNPVRLLNNNTAAFVGDYSIDLSANTLQNLSAANNAGITNNIVNSETLTIGAMSVNLMTGNRVLTINGSGNTLINGSITTTTAFDMPLTYSGTGSLTLGGTASNWNAGTVTVSSGTLRLGNDEVIPHGFNVQTPTTAAPTVITDVTVVPNTVATQFTVADTSLLTVGQVFNGAGVAAGSRILSIDSPTTFTSVITTAASTSPAGTLLTFAPTGNVVLNPAIGVTAVLDLNGKNETINGLTGITAGTIIIDNSSAAASSLTVGGSHQVTQFNGSITRSGGGGITLGKIGTGLATYSGPADVTAFNVQAGTLRMNGSLTSPAAVTGVTVAGGATLQLYNLAGVPLPNLTTLSLGVGSGIATLELDAGTTTDTLTTSAAAIIANTIRFNIRDVGLVAGNSYPLLVAPSGLTGTYTLGPIGGYSGSTLTISDTLVQLNVGSAVVGNMYWTGLGLPGPTDTTQWNTVDGTGNGMNWASDKAGTTLSTTVPGAGSSVIFQANNATVTPLATTLEQSFQINNLIVETAIVTPTQLTIAPGAVATNRLTIAPALSTDGIELKTGATPGLIISAPFSAGTAQTWSVADSVALTGATYLTTGPGVSGVSTTGLQVGMTVNGPGIPAGATVAAITGPSTFDLSVNPTAAGTAVNLNATSFINISGGLSGSGNITKTGPGKAIVSGTGTYTGTAVNVNGGLLEIGAATVLGGVVATPGAGATVTLNSGGTFYINAAATTVSNNLVLNGGTLSAATGNHTYSGTVNVSANSAINMLDPNTLNNARNITLPGVISGTGQLTVNSITTAAAGNQLTGTLALNGVNGGWSGGLLIQRGSVSTNNQDGLGTGGITFNPFGRITWQGLNGATYALSNSITYADNAIAELTIDNTSGTVSSPFTVNFNGPVSLGASSGMRVFLADAANTVANFSGAFTLNGDASISVGGSAAGAVATISGIISEIGGARTLSVNDDLGTWATTNRTLRLTGLNTFTGGLVLAEGVLEFDTVSNVGGAASSLGQGSLISIGAATLNFIGGTPQSTDRPITQTGSSTLAANGTSGAIITFTGAIAGGASSLTLDGSGGGFLNGILSQTVGGTNDLNKNGAGTWTLAVSNTIADDINANAGTLNINASQAVGDDIVVTGVGTVVNLNGANIHQGDDLFIRTGGTVNLGVNGALGVAGAGMDDLVIADTASTDVPKLDLKGFTSTVDAVTIGLENTAAGKIEDSVGGGILTAASYTVRHGEASAILAGAGGVAKNGAGTFTLSGSNTFTGASSVVEGNLILDYTTNNNSKVASAAGLTIGGGVTDANPTLTLNSNAAAASTQAFTVLTLNQGSGNIVANSVGGQAMNLNFTTITRNAGSTVDFTLPATGSITTTQPLTNGILGGYATLNNGASFASKDGLNNLVAPALAAKDDVTTWLATDNVTDTTGYINSLVDCVSVNSITFTAANSIVNATGRFGINSGGVLVSGTATNAGIAGGTLVSGANDIMVHQYAAGDFAISSAIRGSTAITKTGNGSLLLTGNSTSTGTVNITEGLVKASGGSAIGDFAQVNLKDVAGSGLQILASETVGGFSGGGLVGGNITMGTNTLTVNQTTATTFSGQLIGSGTLVKQGAANLEFNTSSMTGFTGSLVINQGLVFLSGNGTVNMPQVGSITSSQGGAFLLDFNSGTTGGSRVRDAAAINLSSYGNGLFAGLQIRSNQDVSHSETVGAINLQGGANLIGVAQAGGTDRTLTLTGGSLNRANNATVFLAGRNLAVTTGNNRGRIFFTGAPALVGGTGVAGSVTPSTSVPIIRYAVTQANTAAFSVNDIPNTFANYNATTGVTPLLIATEYQIDSAGYTASADANDNLRFTTGATGLATKAFNVAVFDSSAAAMTVSGAGGGTNVLTIGSGAMLFTSTAIANGTTLDTYDSLVPGVNSANEWIITTANTTATINSVLADGGGATTLTKSGTGTLVLGAANSYTGPTVFNQGIVRAGTDANLGVGGALNFFGGTLQFGGVFDPSSRTITFNALGGGGTFDTNGNDIVIANAIGNNGTGSLTKTGTGNLTLNAAATHTGGTTVVNGTLTAGVPNIVPAASNLTVNGATAVLDVGAFNQTVNTLTLTAGTVNGTATITATDIQLQGGAVSSGVVLAGTNVVKSTAGVTTLSGNNTFTGPLSVVGGELSFNSIANADGTPSALGAPTTAAQGAIQMGLGTAATILTYTGSGHASNRNIELVGTTGATTVSANGTGALSIGAVTSEEYGSKSLILRGTSAPALINHITGPITECFGVVTLQKLDANTWQLDAASTYTGATQVDDGTLLLGINNALPAATALRLGNGTTAGTLDLNGFNQTIGSLTSNTNSTTATNNIIVDSGNTLTINGAVTLGVNADVSTTLVNATGGGAIVVNSGGANFQVGGATGGTNENTATVDFTGLASFTANLGTGTFRIGDANTASGTTAPSTMKLAPTSTITAANIRVGDSSGFASNHTLVLGSGVNALNADTINIGSAGAGIRSSGTVNFDAGDTTGSVVIRGSAGGSAPVLNFNMVNSTGNTAANMDAVLDFSGHTADLLADTFTMAARSQSTGGTTASLSFNQGTLDITTLNMASRTGVGTGNASATINLGDSVAPGTPTTTIDTLNMAVNTSAGGTVTADLNVTGGTVIIGTGTGTAINMANAAASRTATSTMDLTGGTVSVTGNIIRTGGAGTENATITLDGSTLDMNANSIGSASATIAVVAASGTLKNLGELNGGGVLDKTTAGTLFLEGNNTYTGGSTVTAGNLAVNNTVGSGTGTGAITVASGATLSGNGAITPAAGNNITVNGTLAAGSPGRVGGEDLSITLLGASTMTLNNTIKFSIFTNTQTGTLNGAGASDLLDVNAPDWSNIIFGTNYILEVATTLDTSTWVHGDAWQLFDWTGITAGSAPAAPALANLNLPLLSGGATWDTSQVFNTGVISIVVVPEPSRAILLLFGLLALAVRRRRN